MLQGARFEASRTRLTLFCMTSKDLPAFSLPKGVVTNIPGVFYNEGKCQFSSSIPQPSSQIVHTAFFKMPLYALPATI